MKMTDLIIGEHYTWEKKRVKLLATGVVLKNYQHKGVQIEVPGRNAILIKTVPAREITGTWEDFQAARAEWDREEQIKHDQHQQMRKVAHELREAMTKLGIYDPQWTSLNAYPGYVMLSFNDAEHVEQLSRALQALADARGKAIKLIQNRPGV